MDFVVQVENSIYCTGSVSKLIWWHIRGMSGLEILEQLKQEREFKKGGMVKMD